MLNSAIPSTRKSLQLLYSTRRVVWTTHSLAGTCYTSWLYPDSADVLGQRMLVKVVSGPGWSSEDLKALFQTEGIYLPMGVPNKMVVDQETDQQSNYDTFKSSLCQNRN
jgi:hypothetical protein